MITFEEARQLVQEKVAEHSKRAKIDLVLVDKHTITFEFGWMFFYQSEEYVKTGNFLYLLGGNAPIIVDKMTGAIVETGTGKAHEFYIEAYCKYRDNLDVYYNFIQ